MNAKNILKILVLGFIFWMGSGYLLESKDSSVCQVPMKAVSKEFERLKSLVGVWKGKTMVAGKENEITVEYSLTAGGSVLVEKLFPGMPHEMLSVYHDEGGVLAMTHYCMLGNQPHIELKKSDQTSMEFVLKGTQGLSNPNEPHMHALSLVFKDANTIVQKWTSYENGKEKNSEMFTLSRAK